MLVPRFLSAFIVSSLILYVYGVIGEEIFKGVKVKDCCNGTFIEDFFDDRVVVEKKDEVFFNLQDKGKYD